jgi:hypothetical protein
MDNAEREMLHGLLAEASSLIDPEAHADLTTRIEAVLIPCDEAGACVPTRLSRLVRGMQNVCMGCLENPCRCGVTKRKDQP